jgi:excisionase family DNA binding protein
VKGSDNVEYYSVKEIAELLSVNEETVRRWIRDEKLDAERGSGRQGSKVTSEALNKFLVENKGLMTTVAASTLGISASGVLGAAVGGVVGTLASPLAVSVIAGASWLSILKGKNKDRRTIKLELMEKEIELENLAMRLKNEIALKQNELELVERQIMKMNEITSELDEGGKKDGENQD